MNIKSGFKKLTAYTLATGATLSLSILSFAGMYLISPSVLLCISAFVFAAAYEGKINFDGISIAINRLTDPNSSKADIIENHIKKIDNEHPTKQEYNKIQNHLTKLQKKLHILQENLSYWQKFTSMFYHTAEIKQTLKDIATTKYIKRTFLLTSLGTGNLDKETITSITKKYKQVYWLNRLGFLICGSAGTTSALASIGSLNSAIVFFPLLTTFPLAGVIILVSLAGAGYAALVYQTFSDLILDNNDLWKNFFAKKKDNDGQNESWLRYSARLLANFIAIGFAIFSTITMTITWFHAIKQPNALLHLSNKITNFICKLPLWLMTIGDAIFGIKNSIETINKTNPSTNIRKKLTDIGSYLKKIKYNPFLILEKAISYIAKPVMFALHITSTGVQNDNTPGVNPFLDTAINAVNEGLSDLNYLIGEENDHKMEDHEAHHDHDHNSTLLDFLFTPITITCFTLKCLGLAWDWIIHKKSFADCKHDIFPSHKHKIDLAGNEAVKIDLNDETWQEMHKCQYNSLLSRFSCNIKKREYLKEKREELHFSKIQGNTKDSILATLNQSKNNMNIHRHTISRCIARLFPCFNTRSFTETKQFADAYQYANNLKSCGF